MDNKIIDRAIVIFGAIIIIFFSYLTLRSLLIPIFLAFILGYALRPVYNSIYKFTKSEGLSAWIVIIFLISLVVIPLTFLMPALVKQTFNIYLKVQDINIGNFVKSVFPSTISPEVLTAINLQVNNVLSKLFSSLLAGFSSFLTNLPVKIMNFLIFTFIFYFVLVGFDKMKESFADFVPLSPSIKKKFTSEFKNVTDGIIYGQILIGILQGVLVGLMVYLLGIEGVLLFTIIAIIAGILPIIGPSVIWIPLGIYLFAIDSPIRAIILIVYCNIVSWGTDGFIRPYILSRRTVLSVSLGFVSTLGGLFAFGLIGLVLGPLVISYLIIILQFYKEKRLGELFRS